MSAQEGGDRSVCFVSEPLRVQSADCSHCFFFCCSCGCCFVRATASAAEWKKDLVLPPKDNRIRTTVKTISPLRTIVIFFL